VLIATSGALAQPTPSVTAPQLDHRRKLLALHPGSGFDDVRQINEIYYAFNPGRFAVESYRHWTHQPDPRAYLRRVLHGGEIQGLSEP
jgi:hypothetical protein